MTWASIVAAPPPPVKTPKVGLKVKPKSAIPSSSVHDVDKATFEVKTLSLDDVTEPEGFVDINIPAHVKDSSQVGILAGTNTEVGTGDSRCIKDFTPINDNQDTEIESYEGCARSSKVEKTEAEALNEYLNPKGDKTIQWCVDHKDEILDLHSSVAWTKVFQK